MNCCVTGCPHKAKPGLWVEGDIRDGEETVHVRAPLCEIHHGIVSGDMGDLSLPVYSSGIEQVPDEDLPHTVHENVFEKDEPCL